MCPGTGLAHTSLIPSLWHGQVADGSGRKFRYNAPGDPIQSSRQRVVKTTVPTNSDVPRAVSYGCVSQGGENTVKGIVCVVQLKEYIGNTKPLSVRVSWDENSQKP